MSLIIFYRNVDWNFLPILSCRLAATLLHFLVSLQVVRGLGANEAGKYFTAYAVVMIIGVLGRRGTENVVVRIISECDAASDSFDAGSCVRVILQRVLMSTLTISIVFLFLMYSVFSLSWKLVGVDDLFATCAILCFGIFFYNLMVTLAQGFLGKHKQIFNILYINLAWMSIFVFFGAIFQPATSVELAWLFNVSVLIVSALSALHWFRVEGFSGRTDLSIRSRISLMSRNLFAAETSIQLLLWSPVMLIGFFLTAEDATNYTVAARIASVSIIVMQAVNAYFAPKFSRAVISMTPAELKSLYFQAALIVFMLSIPVVGVVFIWSKEFVSLYELAPEPAATYLRVLVFGQMFSVLSGSAAMFLIMSGGDHQYRFASVLSVVVGIGLALLLCGYFRVYGVLFGVVVASVLNCILLLLFQRQKFIFGRLN